MYKQHKVSISIPAYNEAKFLQNVVNNIPQYVDYIVVVNDASVDDTKEVLLSLSKNHSNLCIINSEINEGVGSSVIKAHSKAVELGADVLVAMSGDGQMYPNYIFMLLDSIIDNNTDFAKGNRFINKGHRELMPRSRVVGNIFFTLIHKTLTGYKHIGDPLNGFTAIKSDVFNEINKNRLGKRYDYEVSLLSELIRRRKKIVDLPIPCKYADEVSDIRIIRDSFSILLKMLRR